MSDDGPAILTEALPAKVGPENADAAASPAPASAATGPALTVAPAASEPDLDSLLKNEGLVNKLLDRVVDHPKAQQKLKSIREADIERRADEKASARVRQAQAAAAAQLQQAQSQQHLDEYWSEVERRIQADPDSPLSQLLSQQLNSYKSQKVADRALIEARTALEPALRQHLQEQIFAEAGNYWMSALDQLVDSDDGLTSEEKLELNPRNSKYTSAVEFLKAWAKLTTSRQAQKLAKSMAKTEAEAILQSRLATSRQAEQTPVALPSSEAASTGEQFMSDYAHGKSNDTSRQLKWMRDNGIL